MNIQKFDKESKFQKEKICEIGIEQEEEEDVNYYNNIKWMAWQHDQTVIVKERSILLSLYLRLTKYSVI